MNMITIGAAGIAAVLLAVQLKAVKSEYSTYLIIGAGVLVFAYSTVKLQHIVEALAQLESYIGMKQVYLTALLKMIGIAYLAEFASGICKDAGYGAFGNQIEIFGKLSILAVSMPVLLALFGTLEGLMR